MSSDPKVEAPPLPPQMTSSLEPECHQDPQPGPVAPGSEQCRACGASQPIFEASKHRSQQRGAGRSSTPVNGTQEKTKVSLSIPTDLDALMGETQAAELACVSVRTLQTWRLKGGGPRFAKLGRVVRYRRRDIIEWVEGHLANSTSDKGGR